MARIVYPPIMPVSVASSEADEPIRDLLAFLEKLQSNRSLFAIFDIAVELATFGEFQDRPFPTRAAWDRGWHDMKNRSKPPPYDRFIVPFVIAASPSDDRRSNLDKARRLWDRAASEQISRAGAQLGRPSVGFEHLRESANGAIVDRDAQAATHVLLVEMKTLLDLMEKRASRSQWRFFGLGLLVSFPIGIFINILTS